MNSPQIEYTLLEEALTPLSRRRFLQGTLAAATLTVAACSGSEKPASGLKTLVPAETALFTKAIAVLLPTDRLGLTPTDKVPVIANIDTLLSRMPAKLRGDLGIAFRMFEWGSVVIGWHGSRFSKLNEKAAVEYCTAWQSGNTIQRGVFGALKQLVYMSYWREPSTWGPIGYEGPVTERFGLVRLGNAPFPG